MNEESNLASIASKSPSSDPEGRDYLSWHENFTFFLLFMAVFQAFFGAGYWIVYPPSYNLVVAPEIALFGIFPAFPFLAFSMAVINFVPVKAIYIVAAFLFLVCATAGGAAGYFLGCLMGI